MLARDGAVLRHVGHDVLPRKQEVEFAEALRVALELVTQEWFHGSKGIAKNKGRSDAATAGGGKRHRGDERR
jgi:hypothetical protein